MAVTTTMTMEFLLLGGHTLTGAITAIQFDALMRELHNLPAERRGYIRVNDYHWIHEGYSYETVIPYNHIVAVRYENKELP